MYSVDATTQPVVSQSLGQPFQRTFNNSEICFSGTNRTSQVYVEIIEQPVSDGARFRYKCEGRSAGCIRGVNSTEKQKTYPTIKVHGYQGAAGVVVSCVTKDGPPYYPHPHNLVGKTCTNGVCYKPINNPDMICSFSNLGIQCVKRRDIKESLLQRESLQVDPFGTGFAHHAEPNKINLNALRLCFQVFIPDSNGKLCVPLPPVISAPIFDNKTVSDLTITKLSHCSAPVTGGQEIILLCDQVNKDDIQIIFFEKSGKEIVWSAFGKFSPHHVHRKAAISFQTPAYQNLDIQQQVNCFIHLRRPSDGTVGKPRPFTLLPLKKDPEGMARKRNKFEALRLDKVLQLSNLPTENSINSGAFPRVIKHARSRTNYQSNVSNQFSNFAAMTQCSPSTNSSIAVNVNYSENPSLQMYNQSKPSVHTTSAIASNSRQKVEDILAIASEQVGLSTAQNVYEPSAEDALDKLNSLDFGLNSSDLDVNLSGMTIDSFSETTGLNFFNLCDGKNADNTENEKLPGHANCT